MYTQNKYNTAICTYIAVALGAAATTVLMFWPLAWSSWLHFVFRIPSRYCVLSHNFQKIFLWIPFSDPTTPMLVKKLRTPRLMEIFFYSNAYLMSHAVSCWLATALSRAIICLTYQTRYTRSIKMVIDEIWCGRWLNLFRRKPG